MPSFHDERGQLCISPLELFLYSTMDLGKNLSIRSKQYSGEGIPKLVPPHCRKVSSQLNPIIMTLFQDEIVLLFISPFPSFSIPLKIWAKPFQHWLRNKVEKGLPNRWQKHLKVKKVFSLWYNTIENKLIRYRNHVSIMLKDFCLLKVFSNEFFQS